MHRRIETSKKRGGGGGSGLDEFKENVGENETEEKGKK